jgi:hypothetical protein
MCALACCVWLERRECMLLLLLLLLLPLLQS